MESFHFIFPAKKIPTKATRVGSVSSGDLEILVEPSVSLETSIQILTSVEGSHQLWKNVLDRVFSLSPPVWAVTMNIHDFGATPGVIRLRLEQAFEEVSSHVDR